MNVTHSGGRYHVRTRKDPEGVIIEATGSLAARQQYAAERGVHYLTVMARKLP